MRQRVCHCGRPFTPSSPSARGCPRCAPAGRANRSPTTRAQDSEYLANRAALLASAPSCHWCPATATTADHLVPVANGGTNDASNLVAACARCNSSRQDREAP